MIDRQPAAIAACVDTADVITALAFGRDAGLEIAVRGGGHHANGFGVWDGALTIDLSNMRGVDVVPGEKKVRVQGGAVWGDVDHATHPFGFAVPSGIIGSTGVAGLTLGGGLGNLSRGAGLTVDNLESADVVLADGSLVTASETSHPDLFWALRGGGGNFGIVTSFTFRGHDVATIFGGPVLYDIGDTGDVLRWYRDLLPTLPRDLGGWFAVLTIPPAAPFPEELWGRKACGVVWCYTGDLSKADQVFKPLTEFGSPILVGVHDMPFPMLQSAFDALFPKGLQWYWRADFFREITDEAIAAHEKFGAELPTGHSTMHLYPIDGRGERRRAERHRVRLPRRHLGRRDRRCGPRAEQRQAAQGLGHRLLGGAASHVGRWRVREHDDGRGAGADPRCLRAELRPARRDQARLRPRERLPRQPEHPTKLKAPPPISDRRVVR